MRRLRHLVARFAHISLRVLGWALLIVCTLMVILFAALELPVSRNVLRAQLNRGLGQLFKGTLVIDRIGNIGIFAISGIDAHLTDAKGNRVLTAKGLRVKSIWPRMLPSILRGQPLTITIDRASCDHVEAILIDDGTGSPTLAGAFLPRSPTPDTGPSTTSIVLPAIRVKHVWAHGGLSHIDPIDVELTDIAASFAQRPDRMQALLDHLTVTARSMPARLDPSGILKATVTVPSAPGAGPSLSSNFEGKLMGARSSVRAHLQGDQLRAQLNVTELEAETLRHYVPSLTLQSPSSIDALVQGTLSDLRFTATAENSALHLALNGNAALGPTKNVIADLELTRINLAQITDAPVSNLQLRFGTTLKQSRTGRTDGTYHMEIPQGEAGGVVTPPVHTAGSLQLDSDGSFHVTGNLSVDEPGAYGQLQYQVHSQSPNDKVAQGKLSVQFTRPARAQRFLGVTASGAILAEARIDLASSQLSSTMLLDVRPIAASSSSVESLRARATAAGPLGNPTFHVDSAARGLAFGARHFSRVLLSVDGNTTQCALKAQVQEGQKRRIDLSTELAFKKLTELIEPRITLASEQADEISVKARRVAYEPGAVRVERLELTGAGELTAEGRISELNTDLKFSLSDLQLTRIMRSLGVASELKRGSFTAEGHVSGPIRRLHGAIRGHIDGLHFGELRGGNIGLDVSVNNSVAAALIDAHFGHSHLTTRVEDLDMPVGRIDRRTLLRMRGKAHVNGSIDLERVQPLLLAVGVPVQRAKGQLQLVLDLENPRNGPAAPRLTASVKTQELKFVERRKEPHNVETASAAREAQPVSVEGVDLTANLVISSEEHKAGFWASLTDKLGTLAHLTVESHLPDLATTSSLLVLQESPVKIELTVPERSLDALPRFVRPQGLKGYVSADVHFAGTARAPKLDAAVAVRRLKYRPRIPGIRADAQLHYESDRGELSAIAFSGDRKVAEISSQWSGNLLAKLRSAQGYAGFALDGDVNLVQFPVGVVPSLADHSIRGVVSCDLRLRDWGKDANLHGRIDGSRLTIRNQRIAALQATVEADGRRLTARLEADQNPGALRAEFNAPLQWGSRFAPAMGAGAKATLTASQFQIETLSPLLLPTVSELQGTLDAEFDAQFTEGPPHLKGFARLKQATVEVPQVGQRFSDVAANVSIDGSQIRLDSLQARGTTGRVTASASLALQGTELQSASARLDISSKEKLPITFEGVEVGDAWGHVDFSYAKKEQGTTIRVDVPNFHMLLPEESMASVQSLGADEHIQVGMFGQDGRFVAIPVQPLAKSKSDEPSEGPPTKLQIHLGNSVWVQRAQQAKVQLTGDLTVTAGEPTRIDGQIDLRGGTLDVNGKTFHVENGTVAFTGADSTDPTITATARWDSPAGYSVYAQYAGTVKDGKLTLRAEPQLTQNEIISLLLFGSPEGALGASAGGGGAAATAVGVAGDTAAKGLNRMINDFTHLDVSARIDTSTGSARPELVVQVTPRLTTRVTRALGEPAPGQSPDRTFLTMELRLRRAWALSGVVGDRGASSLDLIWRHRY